MVYATVTPALREYVEKKIGKIERYFDNMPEVKVNLKVNGSKQKIEVTVPLSQWALRAEEEHADLYAAIDIVVDKLERQIRKHKTKVNRKMREKGADKYAFVNEMAAAVSAVAVEEDEELELVRTKRFDLKPMDPEEAVLQMNMLGHNFYIFTNGETDETNIVYSRKDGKYGIIEAN